jgi:acyl-CoA thioesterase I
MTKGTKSRLTGPGNQFVGLWVKPLQGFGTSYFCGHRTTPYFSASMNYKLLFLAATALAGWQCTSRTDSQQTQPGQATETPAATRPAVAKKTILFYGNSLSAGLGVEPNEAFPALVGDIIDSLNLNYQVVNAGLSGETTAGGKSRISWVMRKPVDVFVLELGGNDGLRGIPLTDTRRNLQAIIDTVRAKSPQARIVMAGMQIPPNMGVTYTKEFRELFKQIADRNELILIPFLLEGVGGDPKLNQPDGIHPTVAGHQIVAQTVWTVLEPLLQ